MSGLKIVVPTTFTDTTLPILRDDAILTPGSIVLIDFAHSANPLAAGVPATGSSIPNIAWKEAAAAYGSGTQADWAMAYADSLVKGPGQDGFTERTAKGGIHVVASQATTTGATKGVTIGRDTTGSGKLGDYLFANWGHTFYYSLWQRITRAGLTSTPELPDASIAASGSATLNYLVRADRATSYGAGLQQTNAPALPQAIGNAFRANGVAGGTGTAPASAAAIRAFLMGVGSTGSYGSFGLNKSRSAVLYRAYFEDLTVSGRTFAQASAIDKALFDQAFAPGGRYYGDTFTDPATYP
ncbi:hypothetical protein [Sphingomonas sp. PP-CC-1A-547]|uniref:hypothetical protein n=1 Tax=Sphingomonas sp. PP-CC-1A-547 TaxID=2135654 RepID=UPI000E74DA2B|nr:hypothetical protein [Sphingomonas sp. PP-CC-1A-547]RKE50308.1 hypothetical protein C8J39_1877 [Sphingomonas sp. PP-CC-1A-547]